MRFLKRLVGFLWALSPLVANHPLLVDTEPEPSSVVAGVNAITGKYASKYTDLTVQGAQPISLTRVYLGSVQESKSGQFDITGGWRWFCHASAVIGRLDKDPTLHVSDSNGTYLAFLPKDNVSKAIFKSQTCKLVLSANALDAGYCNTSRGMPSAKHDISSTYVETEKDLNGFFLHCSDGTVRYYKCIGKDENKNHCFLITREKHPDGSLTHYDYRFELKRSLETIKKMRRYAHTNGLKRIWTSNPDGSRVYAWLSIDYKGSRKATRDFEVTTSDSKSITYKYTRLENIDPNFWKKIGKPEVYLLSQVYGDNIQNQQIAYYTEKKHADPLIWLYQFPKNRQQVISYYCSQGYDSVPITGESINVKNYKHPAYQRVKSIITRHRGDSTYIQYAFSPKPEEHTSKVIDSMGAYRLFQYNESSRLTGIKHFSKDGKCLKSEKLNWQNYRLASRQLLEGSGQIIHTRYYTYDSHGNIIKETLKGPQLETTITRSYSPNGKHLLQEKFPEGLVINYQYLPGTDLLTAKYYCDGNRVIKRQLWSYDKDNRLIETIEEDTRAAIKKIHRIKKNQNDNFYGMPELIEDLYFCPNTKQEILLKKQKLHYDKYGNIEYREIFDGNNTFRYRLDNKYDDHGNLIFQNNPLGQKATYSYDANDNCTYKKDFGGVQTYCEFDLQNRPIQKTVLSPEGNKRNYRNIYNQLGQIIESWDHSDNPTQFTYDPLGRCIATKHPKCPVRKSPPKHPITKKAYDATGNITQSRDADGNITKTTYNVFGQPLIITYPDHSTESYHYDKLGRVTTHINKAGTPTHYTYDVLGRITKKSIEGEQNIEETFEYNGFACTKHTDAEGYTTHNQYDGAGRLIKTEREGHITTYAYDELGRQTIKTHHNNKNTLTYQTNFDLLDRPIENKTLDQENKTHFYIKYNYDPYGNKNEIHRFIDGKVAIEHFTYDGFGRLRKHTNALGSETKHQYKEKQLQQITTAPNQIQTIKTFDALKRLILLQKFQNKQEIFREERSYTSHGNLIAQTNGIIQPVTTQWKYDSCHRPIKLTEAGTRTTLTTYTPTGQKATITKPDGAVLTYKYNALGKLSSLQSTDKTIDYTYHYNRLGQLTQATDHTHSHTTIRTWDAHGNLISEALANNLKLSSQYDLANNKIELTYPDQSRAIHTYNGPHLSSITYLDPSGAPKASHQYTAYDLNSNPLKQETAIGSITNHHDKLNTTTQTQSPIHSHTIHAFDPVHNPLKSTLTIDNASTTKTFAYDAHDQLIAENQNNYTYDSNYNRLSDPNQTYQIDALNQLQPTPTLKASYDPNGNQTQTNTHHLEYDALDRLISVTQNSISHQYQYDPLHRRIKSTTQDTETLYYYDHQNEIGSISSQSTEKRILGHSKGAEIGATVAIELNDEIFTPIHDLYGNIIAIVNDETQTYAYDAFGNHQSSQHNPWRYASKRCDPTGLIYYGKRFYDPTLGRWLTPDPAGYTDSSNLYQYNLNNPQRYFDPYGETLGGFLLGMGEVVVGAVIVGSFAAIEVATCGGFTFAIGVGVAGASMMAHGAAVAVSNAYDLSGSNSSRSAYRSYDGYDPLAEEYLCQQEERKQNPFEGPVDEDTFIVDIDGNAVPIKEGNWATGSKDGKWIQEREPSLDNPKGVSTGVRKDDGHPESPFHRDPRSQQPHGHIPGVTNPDGTPWLIIHPQAGEML